MRDICARHGVVGALALRPQPADEARGRDPAADARDRARRRARRALGQHRRDAARRTGSTATTRSRTRSCATRSPAPTRSRAATASTSASSRTASTPRPRRACGGSSSSSPSPRIGVNWDTGNSFLAGQEDPVRGARVGQGPRAPRARQGHLDRARRARARRRHRHAGRLRVRRRRRRLGARAVDPRRAATSCSASSAARSSRPSARSRSCSGWPFRRRAGAGIGGCRGSFRRARARVGLGRSGRRVGAPAAAAEVEARADRLDAAVPRARRRQRAGRVGRRERGRGAADRRRRAHVAGRLAARQRGPAVPRRRGAGRVAGERAGDRRGRRVADLHDLRRRPPLDDRVRQRRPAPRSTTAWTSTRAASAGSR